MTAQTYDYDYIIVGSGFGGSVSAHRLTEKGYSVAVMEMGKRWGADDFPKTNWQANKYYWRPGLGLKGFFNLRPFKHVMIVCGNAVGGGSITYANTLLRPPKSVWEEGSWAGLADWQADMPRHYDAAERMLGVRDNQIFGPADDMLKKMGEAAGVGASFKPTRVATFFPPAGEAGGKTYPDPYFGGEGPARATCVGCGGCMTGCRYNAKNTLDKNYLYLAEKHGAQVFAETRVVDVAPLNGRVDGADGYRVATECSTARFNKRPRWFTARKVIFAASSLGTQELLFKLKQNGSLPNISDDLGNRVRTNAESLLGIRFPDGSIDTSKGVAIGSSIYLDKDTHIEATRFGAGHDMNSTLSAVMVDGTGITRIVKWLWLMLRHPGLSWHAARPKNWASQALIFLVMQTLDASLSMRFKRRWYWPFTKLLCSEGDKIPTNIPIANDFTRKMAAKFGGIPFTTITEILFNVPLTAHCMGGCAMADTAENGVIDAQNKVFNYHNLYVIDGAMLGANLGVNPSLTITALAERAMAFIPPKAAAVDDEEA